MHSGSVLRDCDEPRTAAIVAFVGLPEADLKGQDRFVLREAGLHGGETRKLGLRAATVGNGERFFPLADGLVLLIRRSPGSVEHVQQRARPHAFRDGERQREVIVNAFPKKASR